MFIVENTVELPFWWKLLGELFEAVHIIIIRIDIFLCYKLAHHGTPLVCSERPPLVVTNEFVQA